MLTFNQFCDYVKNNAKKYMSEAFQKNNYEFCLSEKVDDYNLTSCSIYLDDKQQKVEEPPMFRLETAYENYKQTDRLDDIVVMLASRYETIYADGMAEDKSAYPNVDMIPGVERISSAYVISNMGDSKVDLFHDDTMIEIATKEESNLAVFRISENVLLVVPVKNNKEFRECIDCVGIMENEDPEQVLTNVQIMLYDKNNNVVIEDKNEIEEVLYNAEKKEASKKRSVFSRG